MKTKLSTWSWSPHLASFGARLCLHLCAQPHWPPFSPSRQPLLRCLCPGSGELLPPWLQRVNHPSMVSGGMPSLTSLIGSNLLITALVAPCVSLSQHSFAQHCSLRLLGFYFISVSIWFCSCLSPQLPAQSLMNVQE